MSISTRLYERIPDRVQPLIRHGYMMVHPRVSWRKWSETTDRFVASFFDDAEEYESYRSEFWDGRIVDICHSAVERLDGGETIYDAHRDECERLYALVRTLQPATVVETGVYHGVSTTSILLGLAANDRGTLHSIDNSARAESAGGATAAATGDGSGTDRHVRRERPSCAEPGTHTLPPGREPGWIIPDDLRDRWELRTGSRRRELPALLSEVGEVDVFHHDSEHSTTGMLFEFEVAWEWLATEGVLVSCHVDWNDAFETFVEERPCEHGLMSYTFYADSEFDVPCSSGYAIKTG